MLVGYDGGLCRVGSAVERIVGRDGHRAIQQAARARVAYRVAYVGGECERRCCGLLSVDHNHLASVQQLVLTLVVDA